MLILTRRIGERIKIGCDIIVTLLASDDKRASIGIQAPPDVEILREELQQRPGVDKQPDN